VTIEAAWSPRGSGGLILRTTTRRDDPRFFWDRTSYYLASISGKYRVLKTWPGAHALWTPGGKIATIPLQGGKLDLREGAALKWFDVSNGAARPRQSVRQEARLFMDLYHRRIRDRNDYPYPEPPDMREELSSTLSPSWRYRLGRNETGEELTTGYTREPMRLGEVSLLNAQGKALTIGYPTFGYPMLATSFASSDRYLGFLVRPVQSWIGIPVAKHFRYRIPGTAPRQMTKNLYVFDLHRRTMTEVGLKGSAEQKLTVGEDLGNTAIQLVE